MAAVLQLCTSLGLLQPGSRLCDGVYSTACHCVRQTDEISVCCAGRNNPDDITHLLNKELSSQPWLSRLQISLTEWGDELPSHLFSDTRPRVRKVVLDHNNITSLPASFFSGLRGTRIVSLNHNRLTAVPGAALSLLPRLATLAITNNQISQLTRGQLSQLALLRYLSLADNDMQDIEAGALPRSIVQLSLYNNRLESLGGTLRNLTNMSWLFVSKNRLTSLRKQLPVGVSLHTLTAYENRLKSLDGLQDAVGLSRLFLSSNQLTSIGYLKLPLLKALDLSLNQIEKVSAEQLVGLPALKEVVLAGNRLVQVGPILSMLPMLIKLDLSENRLTSIAAMVSATLLKNVTAAGAHPLQQLYIGGNQLTSLEHLQLPKLRVLDLSDNLLTKLSASQCAGLPSLRELILSGNRLHEIGLLLEALPALTKADFSNNVLKTVTPLVAQKSQLHCDKAQLLHLETLLIRNNSLSSLHVSLHRLPSLCVLDVRDNVISSVRWHQDDGWHCRLQRRKLRLRGNPVSCESRVVRLSLRSAAQNFSMDVPLCRDRDQTAQ